VIAAATALFGTMMTFDREVSRPTVYRWFARFRDDGTWERINHQRPLISRSEMDSEGYFETAITAIGVEQALRAPFKTWHGESDGVRF
jgi:transposase